MIELKIWQFILILVIVLLVAAIVTFFITRKLFARQLEKNPPVNEAMIRAMMTQMGRTPSEKQVRAVMRSMNEAKGK
ncbi:MAG: YneF family protein [Anaeroplasma sp.]|nr:YneF family protein [Anaeroplasma sp.]